MIMESAMLQPERNEADLQVAEIRHRIANCFQLMIGAIHCRLKQTADPVAHHPHHEPPAGAADFDVDADPIDLGPGVSSSLALIAQELVTNCVKHGLMAAVAGFGLNSNDVTTRWNWSWRITVGAHPKIAPRRPDLGPDLG
jgi:hypothetical protein